MSKLGEAFSWVELYESEAPTEAIRREIDGKLAAITAGAATIAEAVGTLDRPELAHVLANLNSAELHVTDYLGS